MHPPRLQRLQLLFTDHPVYFLTTSVADRRPVLANTGFDEEFRNFAKKAADYGVLVGRYVIMPDHLHLFAAFSPSAIILSEWMKALKRTMVRFGSSPFRWQKGFFDHVLRSQESYTQKWEYVRLNPVRAGLVKEPQDWVFQGEIFPLH